jgi:hypothetical protein
LQTEFEKIEFSVKLRKDESFDGVPLVTAELMELVKKIQLELSRDITYKESLLMYNKHAFTSFLISKGITLTLPHWQLAFTMKG